MKVSAREIKLLDAVGVRGVTLPVVYGLCGLDGEVFYVGKAKNLRSRFLAHRRNDGPNFRLRGRISELGADLRVQVLQHNPTDIIAAERAEIASGGLRLVNLMLADDPRWELQTDLPWSVGVGTWTPSRLQMKLVGKKDRAKIRSLVKAMPPARRCRYELEVFADMHPVVQARHEAWLNAALPKMLACMESVWPNC